VSFATLAEQAAAAQFEFSDPPGSIRAVDGPQSAPLPTKLTVGAPPGWSVQPDARTGAVYMKPPGARSLDEAALVVFPAVEFTGTAEDFHSRTLATMVGAGRHLEPVAHGPVGALLVSVAHIQTPPGAEVRLILYTARWGVRAQAIVFAAARADLFQRDAPAATQVVADATVPGGSDTGSPSNGSQATSPATEGSNPPAGEATTGDAKPVLEYTDPPNFWRGGVGGRSFAEYQGSDVNFTLCVYPFREFQGDIRAAFQQTLLRDWVGVMYREESVAGPPQFGANSVPGADTVIVAHFRDGRQQEHRRILIVVGRSAAIVDMIAPTAFAWQKGFASASVMLGSMRVSCAPGGPSLAGGPGPEGAALAGLFQGMRGKTVSNLMLGPGYLSTQLALHYFLFSTDGWVYRCYDAPPGGSEAAARRFDFDAARRQDPDNTGRFTVRGNALYIKMGGPNADEITATIADPNELQLDGVRYTRK
jgi:hypothetical protein